MTLDEAIKHEEKVAEEKDMQAGFDTDYLCYQMSDTERNQCKKYAEEHKQLAEWLKDYKRLLEQQPCEDCISRQVVLDKWENTTLRGRTEFDQVIMMLPPVTPQPKTGHWIGHREHCENLGVMPSGLGAYEWCSNCDCGIDVREWHRNNYNYCPNCGAKMIESEEADG